MVDKIRICLVGNTYKGEDSRSIKFIVEAAKKLGAEVTNIPKGKLISTLIDGKVSFHCEGINIDEQDAFIFRGITGMIDPKTQERTRIFPQIVLFAHYLKQMGKVVFDEFLLQPDPSYTKYSNAVKLSAAGIPNINTWVFMKTEEVLDHIDQLPFPILLKPANSAQGKGIYKYDDKESFIAYLKDKSTPIVFYPNLLQEYIPNDGDFRVVVLGDKVVVALKKHREEENVVANMSQGNVATVVDSDKDLEELAIRTAQVLGMELAGIDIIEDKTTGKRYILEANLSPQIYYSTLFSNKDIGEEIIRFIIEKINKNRSEY